MPFGLWLFTVLCVAIAIVFGIVASIFAVINTVMTPIEVITGLHGLFLWNGMGGKIDLKLQNLHPHDYLNDWLFHPSVIPR